MKEQRPKNKTREDGSKVVYMIWRDDLAEATVFQKEKECSNFSVQNTVSRP
jgi:hypothetical protein